MAGSVDAVLMFEGHIAHKLFKKMEIASDKTCLAYIPLKILNT